MITLTITVTVTVTLTVTHGLQLFLPWWRCAGTDLSQLRNARFFQWQKWPLADRTELSTAVAVAKVAGFLLIFYTRFSLLFSSSLLLLHSHWGPLHRPRIMTLSNSISPHISRQTMVVVMNWSSRCLWERPGRCYLDLSGNWLSDRLVWQCRAWWTGMVCDLPAMWPKELRRLPTCSMTGGKPVWFATSTFQTWS